jgi:hypothetical protein
MRVLLLLTATSSFWHTIFKPMLNKHTLYMAKQAAINSSGEKIPQKKGKSTKLKDKVRKHITDINDVITDDDIRTSFPDNAEINKEIEKKEKELKENAKVNEGNKKDNEKAPVTPWDVINE